MKGGGESGDNSRRYGTMRPLRGGRISVPELHVGRTSLSLSFSLSLFLSFSLHLSLLFLYKRLEEWVLGVGVGGGGGFQSDG